MSTVIQRNFSGGEIAPALYARADTVKYATGARTLRNYLIGKSGGISTRAGTKFVAEIQTSANVVREIPFVFNASQTYVLEFGNLYMRVHKGGNQLRESAVAITGISNANPGVVTAPGHGYAVGDEIFINGLVGNVAKYLNYRNFKIASVTATTFTLLYMSGSAVDTTSLGTYTSGGSASRVYQIATPYAAADLSTLNFTQSADVITIAHPNYPPMEVNRTGDISWLIKQAVMLPKAIQPINVQASGTSGSSVVSYKVTSISASTGEESLPGSASQLFPVLSINLASSPVVVTIDTTVFINWNFITEGEEVMIDFAMPSAGYRAQKCYLARNIVTGTGGHFELWDYYGNPVTAADFVGGNLTSAYAPMITVLYSRNVNLTPPAPGTPITVTWGGNTTSGSQSYNIYRESNGVYGFIGNAYGGTFLDVGTDPDTSVTPPAGKNPFSKSGDWPSAVAYIQQRLTFGNSTNNPEQITMSRSGKFKNFTTSTPVQSDDSITFTLVGRQVNAIKHILELSTPVIFSQGAEWAVHGDISGTITPADINAKQSSYNGCSFLRPIVVGNTALFVQARGTIVRDLAYEVQSDGYTGTDLTVFSTHLFDGFTIVDWDYQQNPNSVIWAIRNDGVVLSLTYIKEHQLWGWSRHDFQNGFAENVCVIPEGNEDAVYFVIRRVINGRTVRYIERLNQRRIDNIVDFIGMDCAKTYDGRNTTSTTLTMTGTGWTYQDSLTLTASASVFQSTDVGNEIFIDVNGTEIRFTIDAFNSSTVVTGRPHKTVPVFMQATAFTTWSKAVTQVGGLWHLEGQNVSAFGDGFVLASPNNASATIVTVTNGTATFDKPHAVIQVGLPMTNDIETLDIESVQGETMTDKMKNVSRVVMQMQQTRGLWAGPKPPTNDAVDPLENLYELKVRNSESQDSPVSLATQTEIINIQPGWNSNGRIFLRQVDPVPATILSIAPAGIIPFRVGG